MGIEEGLGRDLATLEFVVTKVGRHMVETDCFPQKFDRRRYAPFNYEVGQRYVREVWENGEFVSSEAGETYLVPDDGAPIKVEGSLDEFVDRVQAEGRRNKFKRLLDEGKIVAHVRTHAYEGVSALLEVALVEDSNFAWMDASAHPFEAYSVSVNLADGTARIIEAECEFGAWNEKLAHLRLAKPVQLPKTVIEAANPADAPHSLSFRPLDAQSMAFIRQNCYRPS